MNGRATDVLVPPAARERLLAIARAIPDLGDTVGFECRLGPAAGPVDLGLGIRRRAQLFALPPPPPGSPPEWERVTEFCRAWWDPTSLLQAWVPFAFLEFDAYAPGTIPVPSIFVSLDWPLSDPDDSHAEAECRRLSARVVHGALAVLLEPEAHDRLTENLDACILELPDGGRVVHAGAMLGRSAAAARLSIAMPRQAQTTYFTRRGLPDLGTMIETIMESVASEDDKVHLEIDVTAESVGPRVGVVVARDDADGWARVVERVANRGLCTAQERAALLEWAQLSHLKFTPDAAGRLEAKAYLLLPTAA